MSPEYAYLNDFIWGAGITLSLILCPLLPGVIARVKAFFAGRKGPRLLQLYFDLAKLLHRARQAGWLCDDYRVTRADGVPHYVLLLFNLSVPMLVLSPYPGCTSSPQLPYLALDVLAGLIGRAPRVAMYSTGVFCNDNPLSLFRSIFHCFIPLGDPYLEASRV